MKTIAAAMNANMDRAKYLGGSDVAAILGISPWKTPLDVYLDKIQPRVEETDPHKIKLFTRGKRMEPYVIDLLAEETGLTIKARGNRYIDDTYPFIAAEIDAEAASGENIEIKTVSPFKAKEWGEEQSDEIPLHYTAQAMHGLMVKKAPVCLFGVLIGGDDFRIYRVERDDDTIAAIRQKEIEFWQRIQSKNPPEPSTLSDVYRLFGAQSSGLAIECTDAIEIDVLALKSIKHGMKQLEEQKEEREARIKLHMMDAAILTLRGIPVVTWKTQSCDRFDQHAFEEAHPDLFNAFKKTSDTRVLRLK